MYLKGNLEENNLNFDLSGGYSKVIDLEMRVKASLALNEHSVNYIWYPNDKNNEYNYYARH